MFDKNKTTIFTYAKDVVQSDYTVPDSVNYIGNGTFSGCKNLTNIIIPNSVKSIGDSAFAGCYSLMDITIPNSVISIGDSAFQGCTGLTNIIIPYGITSIGTYTFARCYLTSLTIPDSVTSIADYAFERSSVRDLYYSGSISEWKSIKIGTDNASILNASIHYNAVGTATPKIAGTPTVSGSQITIPLADVEYDSDLIAVFNSESGTIDFERIGISAGDTEKSAAIPSGAKSVRVFIWDSLNGMRPLCEAAEADITSN